VPSNLKKSLENPGWSHENYYSTHYAVFYYIPVTLLIVLYSTILIKLKRQIVPGEQSANAEQQCSKRKRNLLKAGADLGVGRGGRGPPFCPDFFFFCKQRLSDGTSCFVTLDIFSAAADDRPCHKCNCGT